MKETKLKKKTEDKGWWAILITILIMNGFIYYYLYCKYIKKEKWDNSFKRLTQKPILMLSLWWMTILNYIVLVIVLRWLL
jgi:cytochrome c-type biogenesis protein CcmH/NrfG